jgi:hypothetical protein
MIIFLFHQLKYYIYVHVNKKALHVCTIQDINDRGLDMVKYDYLQFT